ncbi:hypothetical protein FZC84_17975 [Rossellomorea vietnamensis]|uniref:Uncharacterized protein n=1 Tax=Rossellomorea vietnamensis TaxID=218284 RepID=A0A5D4M9R6_9BACI|nr:DUF5305 family protein [Rossellomorea vietnamensis]TYR97735.1 hypothetical protein FZC84_17975 [Rossellomorea vietnamensis]
MEMNKNIRFSILAAIIAAMGFVGYLLFQTLASPGYTEQEDASFAVNNNSEIDYKVFLKSNSVFEEESLPEGATYFSSIVDFIQADFNVGLSSREAGELTGNYEIAAILTNKEGASEENTNEGLWSKRFILIPSQKIPENDGNLSLNESVKVNLEEYNAFKEKAAEELNADGNIQLTIAMKVDVEGVTENGPLNESISPSLTMPLGSNEFTISEELGESEFGKIESNQKIELPVNTKKVMSYGVIELMLLIGLLYIFLFTSTASKKGALSRSISKIFTDHNNRLVALEKPINGKYSYHYKIKSFGDLLKLADEIGKPVLYEYKKDQKEITDFYLVDENTLYSYSALPYPTSIVRETKAAEI